MRFSIIEIINATELCIIVSINVAKDLRGNRTRKEIKRAENRSDNERPRNLTENIALQDANQFNVPVPDNSDHFCVLNYLKEKNSKSSQVTVVDALGSVASGAGRGTNLQTA